MSEHKSKPKIFVESKAIAITVSVLFLNEPCGVIQGKCIFHLRAFF